MSETINWEEFAELAVLLYEKTAKKSAVPAASNPFADAMNRQNKDHCAKRRIQRRRHEVFPGSEEYFPLGGRSCKIYGKGRNYTGRCGLELHAESNHNRTGGCRVWNGDQGSGSAYDCQGT